jgi:multimeric flavodoxin WrbA
MKVLAINGSPKPEGNCSLSLERIGSVLAKEGIGFEVLNIGGSVIRGCVACGQCGKRRDGRCAFDGDAVNKALPKLGEADGIVLASPVYFSGVAGTMKSFLDRAFYVASSNGGLFRHKAGAALVAVRRSGGSSTLDCLTHYLTYSEMLVATSNYWAIVHGRAPGEAEKDEEGMRTIDQLAENLAWLMKMREAARGSTTAPAAEPAAAVKVLTNFIR